MSKAQRTGAARARGAAIDADRLRRYDWRFLLPMPPGARFRHMVVLGGPPGAAEDVVRLGLAQTASSAPPDECAADAVVLLRGARVRPAEARRWLREGGVLLVEVDRRSLSGAAWTPARLGRALARAGFEALGCWWAKPDHDRCAMYLPLESDAALTWYGTRHHAPRGWIGRVLGAAARLVTGGRAWRFGTLVPAYVVTARVGGRAEASVGVPRGAGVAPGVLGGRGVPATLRPPRARPVVLLGGEGAWSRVVVLPFQERSARPAAVIKHPRLRRYNDATMHEHAMLERIRARVGPRLRATLPAPARAGRWRGLAVSVERSVAGRSVYAACAGGGREAIAALRGATTWLASFHLRSVLAQTILDGRRIDRLLERPVARYAAVFGCTDDERRLFERARQWAEGAAGCIFPVVWQHRDFGPWNVHVEGKRVAVIDWEVARPGPPLCDLFYFTLHWSWLVHGARRPAERLRDFERLFLEPECGDGASRACRRAHARYMGRLELDRRLAPLFLLNLLLEQALDRALRLRAGGVAPGREGNPYVAYIGVLAERPARVFERTWP